MVTRGGLIVLYGMLLEDLLVDYLGYWSQTCSVVMDSDPPSHSGFQFGPVFTSLGLIVEMCFIQWCHVLLSKHQTLLLGSRALSGYSGLVCLIVVLYRGVT